jgi:hypothetical protein
MDLTNYRMISGYSTHTSASVWVIRHSEPQKVILRVLLNGGGRYLKVQRELPLSLENVSQLFIRRLLFAFMNKRHCYSSILNEHGSRVNDGTSDFHKEASEFSKPWERFN